MFRDTRAFFAALTLIGGSYVLLIALMVVADVAWLGTRLPQAMAEAFSSGIHHRRSPITL